MADKLTICNNALGEIAAGFIVSLEEQSFEAENANRLFNAVLAEALAWELWGFNTRRVLLAPVANDRMSEWGYCFALPSDCAKIGGIVRYDATATTPISGPTAGLVPTPHYLVYGDIPFITAGARLYTNDQYGLLEYGTNDVLVTDIPALLVRAIELELAARLVMPIKKDAGLRDDMRKAANVAKQWALADNHNRQPEPSGRRISDVEYARAGYGLGDLA